MTWIDDTASALAASPKIDASLRDLLTAFLQANRPTLEQLGPALGDAFFRTLSDRGPSAAWDLVAQNLSPAQVTALLDTTHSDMIALAADHKIQTDANVQLANSIAQTALTLLVRALLAAL